VSPAYAERRRILWRSCASVQGVKLTLIRSATLRIEYAGRTLLVDPQLDPAGAREAVPNTPHPRRSPLGELPEPPEVVLAGLDAVLVTHLHRDHFDDTAKRLLDKHLPLFCQPPDTERLHADGFTDVRAVFGDANFHGILIARTEGEHGTGEIGRQMAPVSGFVLAAADEPTVYIAGDTILCDEVREAIDTFRPDVIVVNASAAQFNEGGPIVMDNDDVVELARIASNLQIVAVHFECVSHSTETRADLRERLRQEALTNVSVPEDGAAF
jgi:L-ascorbate metabolism protein UlaG (beta-lactamase superfamily)